ncbi:MAG: DUF4142 domain-containing protein, partial [Bacteroidota bacterium]|nr:DUF4142 domain-containing protein [Bacteroidota bacterium]
MKKISMAFLLLTGILIQACNNRDENGSTDTNNTNSSKSVTDSTRGNMSASYTAESSTSTGTPDKESADFVMKAVSGGMLEVQLGQLAIQKAKNQRVKNFGNMMVTDHSKANEELKSLASSKNITIPAALLPDHQKHFDMMKNKSGS